MYVYIVYICIYIYIIHVQTQSYRIYIHVYTQKIPKTYFTHAHTFFGFRCSLSFAILFGPVFLHMSVVSECRSWEDLSYPFGVLEDKDCLRMRKHELIMNFRPIDLVLCYVFIFFCYVLHLFTNPQ